jgi:predicted GH43/DUF377 family glycosyl hydrolase
MHELYYGGLASWAVKRGGSLHPVFLPPEETAETGQMNPSILIHKGKIIFNIRQVNYALYHSEGKRFPHVYGPLQYIHPENDVTLKTDNYVCELDESLDVKSFSKVNMAFDTGKPTWNFIGLEDGRLVEWEDRLFLCGVRRDCYDDKGTGRMEMAEIEYINNEWREVSRNPIKAPNDSDTYCEKNWMPVLDMPWHFVKWTNPTEVVKYDIETQQSYTVMCQDNRKYPFPRDIRGGTQVIRIDANHRMAITHEVELRKDAHVRKDGLYLHRVVIWDNDWNIVKASEQFNFMGLTTFADNGHQYGIEFATGVALHNGSILISYGLADAATFLLKMPFDDFMSYVDKTRIF